MSEIDEKKIVSPRSEDGGPVQTYRDDLYQERKKTLGDYLKSQTSGEQYNLPNSDEQILRKEHKNAFSIGEGGSEFSVMDDEGRPAGIQNSPESQPSFSNQEDLEQSFTEAYKFFDNLSKGRLDDSLGGGSFSNEDLSTLEIDKNNQESGHFLLNNPNRIADKVVSSVLRRNRWTPYQNPDNPESDRRYENMNQSEYNVDLRNPRPEIEEFEADTQKLRNIGRSLLLAASSEDSVASPVDVREQEFDVGSFDLLSFLQNSIPGDVAGEPSPNSLSIDFANTKIPVDRFRPINHDITLDNQSNDGREKNYTASSYGVLNNHIRQFEDQSGRSDMVVLSFLSLVAMIVSSIFTLLIVELISSAATALTGLAYNNSTGRGLGSRVLPSGNSIQKHSRSIGGWEGLGDEALKIILNLPQAFVEYLGIYQPMHISGKNGYGSYSAAVGMGIISLVYAMVKDFGFSSGFFASTFRTVMRSEFTGDELLDNPTGLATNGFDSLVGYFRNLRESRGLKALNYLAKLGDIFYVSYDRDSAYAVKNVSRLGYDVVKGQKEHNEFSKIGRTFRSHPSKVGGKLNWRVDSAASFIFDSEYEDRAYQYVRSDLIGVSIVQAREEELMQSNSEIDEDIIGRAVDKPTRLSAKMVRMIEEQLESEYMPFYFQDLRTNEIIAFHAFLSSLTDGFQPSYNSTKGFGRMDPVMTYGDTTRSISFAFTVYATSKEDFDVMWKKVNKMVTLVYPQWSGGTKVRSADEQHLYTIPYSQIPTASPLIRVRIGDLIKSNYSRKDMTRLFGTSNNDFTAHGVAFGSLYHSIWQRKRRKEAMKQFKKWSASLVEPNGKLFKVSSVPNQPHTTPIKFRVATGADFWIINMDPDDRAKITEERNSLKTKSKVIKKTPLQKIIYKVGFAPTYREDGTIIGHNWQLVDMDKKVGEVQQTETRKGSDGQYKEVPVGEPTDVKLNDMDNGLQESKSLQGFVFDLEVDYPKFWSAIGWPDEKAWIADHFFCEPVDGTKAELLKGFDNLIEAQASALTAVTAKTGMAAEIAAQIEMAQNWKKLINNDKILLVVTKELALGQAIWVQDGFISQEWINQNPEPTDIPSVVEKVEASQKFFDPEKNPIMKAFESTAGTGLPGVITQLGLDWKLNEYPWEIDPGSKAPMGCEITINFQPMHEIAPGLDKNGINRAPVFRVGSSADKE